MSQIVISKLNLGSNFVKLVSSMVVWSIVWHSEHMHKKSLEATITIFNTISVLNDQLSFFLGKTYVTYIFNYHFSSSLRRWTHFFFCASCAYRSTSPTLAFLLILEVRKEIKEILGCQEYVDHVGELEFLDALVK